MSGSTWGWVRRDLIRWWRSFLCSDLRSWIPTPAYRLHRQHHRKHVNSKQQFTVNTEGNIRKGLYNNIYKYIYYINFSLHISRPVYTWKYLSVYCLRVYGEGGFRHSSSPVLSFGFMFRKIRLRRRKKWKIIAPILDNPLPHVVLLPLSTTNNS